MGYSIDWLPTAGCCDRRQTAPPRTGRVDGSPLRATCERKSFRGRRAQIYLNGCGLSTSRVATTQAWLHQGRHAGWALRQWSLTTSNSPMAWSLRLIDRTFDHLRVVRRRLTAFDIDADGGLSTGESRRVSAPTASAWNVEAPSGSTRAVPQSSAWPRRQSPANALNCARTGAVRLDAWRPGPADVFMHDRRMAVVPTSITANLRRLTDGPAHRGDPDPSGHRCRTGRPSRRRAAG